MDSGGKCSEIVTSVIRFTTPKTVTVNHERLPIFILLYFTLFYWFSHSHLSPLEGAIDLPTDHSSVFWSLGSAFSELCSESQYKCRGSPQNLTAHAFYKKIELKHGGPEHFFFRGIGYEFELSVRR